MGKEKFNLYANFKAAASADDTLEVSGLASTFGGNPDRQGDIISPKAFDTTISDYMAKNPILLCDHESKCCSAIGTVLRADITAKGLEIIARISNAMDDYTQSIRTKIQEGILRTFSIGGWFYYDGNLIKQVDLFEISIVPVPANADATFAMKSFDTLVNEFNLKLKADDSQMPPKRDDRSMQSKVQDMAKSLLDQCDNGAVVLKPALVAGLKKIKGV